MVLDKSHLEINTYVNRYILELIKKKCLKKFNFKNYLYILEYIYH